VRATQNYMGHLPAPTDIRTCRPISK
jgi:hypothetical protein